MEISLENLYVDTGAKRVNTLKPPFIITVSLLCPWVKKALTFSLNSTHVI